MAPRPFSLRPPWGPGAVAETMRLVRRTVPVLSVSLAALVLASCAADTNPTGRQPALSDEQREAMAAADWAYAEAWLSNEPETVMRTLTEDAVIVPSSMLPIEGPDAIRAFWWPEDEPPTTVTGFAVRQDEVGGSTGLGYVRGAYSMSFDYDGASFETEGTYLTLLRRGDHGWRISHRVWNDHGLD